MDVNFVLAAVVGGAEDQWNPWLGWYPEMLGKGCWEKWPPLEFLAQKVGMSTPLLLSPSDEGQMSYFDLYASSLKLLTNGPVARMEVLSMVYSGNLQLLQPSSQEPGEGAVMMSIS